MDGRHLRLFRMVTYLSRQLSVLYTTPLRLERETEGAREREKGKERERERERKRERRKEREGREYIVL